MEPIETTKRILQKKVISGKTGMGILLAIYLVMFVFPAFVWALAIGSPIFFLGFAAVLAIPIYVGYKIKKHSELPELERTRIVRRNKLIALVIAMLFVFYAIYSLYKDGGSLSSVFPFLP